MGAVTIQFKNENEVKISEDLFIRWRLKKFATVEKKDQGYIFSFFSDIENITFENFNFDKKNWFFEFKNQKTKVLLKDCVYGATSLIFLHGMIKIQNIRRIYKNTGITSLSFDKNHSVHFENHHNDDLQLFLSIFDSLKTTLTGTGYFKRIAIWSSETKIENFQAEVDERVRIDSNCELKNVYLCCKQKIEFCNMNCKAEDVILESDHAILFPGIKFENKTGKIVIGDSKINDPKKERIFYFLSVLKSQQEKLDKQNRYDHKKVRRQVALAYDEKETKINEKIKELQKEIKELRKQKRADEKNIDKCFQKRKIRRMIKKNS